MQELNNISNENQQEFERNFAIYHNSIGHKTFYAQPDEVEDFKTQKDAAQYVINFIAGRFDWLQQYFA